MKVTLLLLLFLGLCPGLNMASAKPTSSFHTYVHTYVSRNASLSPAAENLFDLSNFGAKGDGTSDDGPALQNALDAIGAAGGGTLFVPAGRYAIITPVQKDFTGLASEVSILGVESLTLVPPPNSSGAELTRGLDLLSEFAPRTGGQGISINITGLQSFLIKDITFIGTPGVRTDAFITLALNNIREATIRHCEFYGLSSLIEGGAIVQGVRSGLNIEQSVFLGSTGNSGLYVPVVQNIEWKRITVTDAVFADYGQRPELYGKLGLAPPLSWVNIGNAAALTSDSPRREVAIRNVFLDEGGLHGLSSLPDRYQRPSAPIDLVYVTGLYVNVSNLGTTGHYFTNLKNVLAENSHYGWSHNAGAAIELRNVGNAILDELECVDHADRIRADAATAKLTVINSVYAFLDSQSPQTRVITTQTPEDDPVQYVRQQFNVLLGRDPDPAAHFYWSDRLLQCGDDARCITERRAALAAYLNTAPSPDFSISGRVIDESGAGLPGVAVTLAGSQSVTTQTGTDGRYLFAKLPTSGVYTIMPGETNYLFSPASMIFADVSANQVADFVATLQNVPNPIDSAKFFVRQHYRDFLNRPADADGLAFWSNEILSCGIDADCTADRRINVSAAFFLSIEFQQTGFLVYRLYRASFTRPPERLNEFLLDTRTIAEGVVVNAPGWEQLLEANKSKFIESFVARTQFTEVYPLDLTPAEFVNQLNLKVGSELSPTEIAAGSEEFAGAATSQAIAARARVLRRVAESQSFSQRELNPAFVLMQYFGYLQRNPYEASDTNLDGYNFWLRKLDEFGGDFRRAEMVKSFLVSGEYRSRFGAP
jgi:hypothetical protein